MKTLVDACDHGLSVLENIYSLADFVRLRKIRYAMAPTGIEQITCRSYRYFKRTIRTILDYGVAIEGLVREVKVRGYRGLVLVGGSDLDFIVEHSCEEYR